MSDTKYRIERRDNARSIFYWRNGQPGAWMHKPESATIFSESERQDFLTRELQGHANHAFPAGGVWVRVESEDRCELREGEDRCPNRATQKVREPYTPAGFTQRVCDECAKSQIAFGYQLVPSAMTSIHDSHTCNLGLDGGACGECVEAEKRETNRCLVTCHGYIPRGCATAHRCIWQSGHAHQHAFESHSVAPALDFTIAQLAAIRGAITETLDDRRWDFYEGGRARVGGGMLVITEAMADQDRVGFVDEVQSYLTDRVEEK